MHSTDRRLALECPKCRHEYESAGWLAASVALGGFDVEAFEDSGWSSCPSCGFRIRRGMTVVREEDGVFIVEPAGEERRTDD